jgi:uncharacterized protein (TIGR02145 family)
MKKFTQVCFYILLISFISSCEDDKKDKFSGDSGTFSDSRDGTKYNWVRLGDQIWMAEDLAYLPAVYDVHDGSEDTGKENDSFYYVSGYNGTDVSAAKATENYQTYGVLYNGYAATTACPDGWHLPTDEEWKQLEKYLGMADDQIILTNEWRGTDEGGKLKESGTTHWDTPNTGATNESGFYALPGGYRMTSSFEGLGGNEIWWTSTTTTATSAYDRSVRYDLSTIFRSSTNYLVGKSVRCIKD